jgi:serine/threonine protein kinase
MSLAPGVRLGPFEILSAIGAGGMGEVYKARDTRLDRTVAIKILHAHVASDPVRRQRFEREARAVAALNHPHICTLHDVGHQDGTDFLVMEYLEGQTLADRLKKGALTLDQALQFAIQITEALDTAHRRGIVHRDLKPSNIMLTKSGAKLLDFGIATIRPSTPTDGSAATRTERTLTAEGTLIGTLNYMAPEQLEGRDAAARSDLWAFGAVLYEMLTGRRAFEGETASRVIAAVLDSEPPSIGKLAPPALQHLVKRCLAKDPDGRWQTMHDVSLQLKWIAAPGTVGSGGVPTRTYSDRRPKRAWSIGFALVVGFLFVAGIAGLLYTSSKSSSSTPPQLVYTQLTHFTDSAVAPSLSPDGRMVTFIRGGGPFLSRGQIYVKLLPNGESVRLTDDTDPKFSPIFTPDGSRVAYSRVSSGAPPSWDTWTVSVLGGEPIRLLPNATGLTWLRDRHVLFSEIKGAGLHMGIVTATESRAEHREIYFPEHDRAMAHYSYASPDSRWILVVEMDRTGAFSQPCRLIPFDASSAGREVGPQGVCMAAAWSPDGQWMYFSAYVAGSSHLWRQQFPDGMPEQITFGPSEEEGVAIAPDGHSLITSLGVRHSAIWMHDARGDRAVSSEGFAFAPTLSQDGKRVFCLLRENSTTSSTELRSIDLDSGKTESVLPGISVTEYEVSRDEKEVVYTTTNGGESQIWLASLDRRTSPRQIVTGGDQASFGADGELIFRKLGQTSNLVFRIKRDGRGLQEVSNMPITGKGSVSPDGAWVMVDYPPTSDDAPPQSWAVPVGGGVPKRICSGPCRGFWSPDGTLFYVANLGPQRTIAFQLPSGAMLPKLPDSGIGFPASWDKFGKTIERTLRPRTGDFSTYVFVKQDLQRNLFRIPLR